MKKAFIVPLLLATTALAAAKKIIVYECPICHVVREYVETSYRQHWCEGDDEKKHRKHLMVKIGERTE